MAALQSGQLDRKLIIEAKTFTRSPVGQPIDAYAPLATVWGQRLALRSEQKAELKPGGEDRGPGPALVATGRYRVRYRTDFAIGQRVTVDGGTYFIVAIEEEDRRTSHILTVSA